MHLITPMDIHITAKHLQLTEPIRRHVQEKAQKAQKYFDRITRIQVVLSVEKRIHQAEVVVHAPKQMFRALAQSNDLYAAMDSASSKIDAQIKKYKERLRNHHTHRTKADTLELVSLAQRPQDLSQFAVVKQVPMRPMSREAAAGEMEAVGHNFWMFLDEESRQIQVVFRRQDDSYGILKPVKWNGK
jgi:putative sigma-54 modulation protein